MKLALLFSVFSFLTATFAVGQDIVFEDFSSNQWPPEGWTVQGMNDNRGHSVTSNAGGENGEAQFHWSPQSNGISRLISPVFDLSGNTVLAFEFRHTVDHYGGPYKLGLATTTDNNNWNTVWEINGTCIEEFDDLKLVAFIQNDATKEVFQSTYADIGVGLAEPNVKYTNVSVFPNPVKDQTTIVFEMAQAGEISVNLLDLSGQIVENIFKGSCNTGIRTLKWTPRKSLVSGLYFIQIQSATQQSNKKISLIR